MTHIAEYVPVDVKNEFLQDNSVANANFNVTLPMFGDKENDHYTIEKIETPALEKSFEIVLFKIL